MRKLKESCERSLKLTREEESTGCQCCLSLTDHYLFIHLRTPARDGRVREGMVYGPARDVEMAISGELSKKARVGLDAEKIDCFKRELATGSRNTRRERGKECCTSLLLSFLGNSWNTDTPCLPTDSAPRFTVLCAGSIRRLVAYGSSFSLE